MNGIQRFSELIKFIKDDRKEDASNVEGGISDDNGNTWQNYDEYFGHRRWELQSGVVGGNTKGREQGSCNVESKDNIHERSKLADDIIQLE